MSGEYDKITITSNGQTYSVSCGGFDMNKYDKGGIGAKKGDGRITGAEFRAAQKDGWILLNGYNQNEGVINLKTYNAPKDGSYATGGGDGIEYKNGALTKMYRSYGSAQTKSLFRTELGSSPKSETTYTYYDEKDGDKAGLVKSQHNSIIDTYSHKRIEQEIDPLTGNILSETYNGQTINYKYDNNGNFISASSKTSIPRLKNGTKETILNSDGTKTVKIFNQGKEVSTYKYNGNELVDYSHHYLKHPVAFLNKEYNFAFNDVGNYRLLDKPSF